MPLSPSHLATPKRHIPVLVLEVPVLLLEVLVLLLVVPVPVAVMIKDHLLPLLLLLRPMLGMFWLLMPKKKLLSILAAPLLLHQFTPQLVVRASSLSLFPSRVFR